MDKKYLRGEIKSADTEDPAGAFVAVLSAPTLDRDGEIIDSRAFEPLPEHIPIDIDHGMDTRSTVGSGRPYYDGDLLMFEGRFASTPLGQETRTLVTEGHVRKMSVAFMDAKREEDEDGVTHITKGELLNAAVVSIPSNRDADILAAKAFQQVKESRDETDLTSDELEKKLAEGTPYIIGEKWPELFVPTTANTSGTIHNSWYINGSDSDVGQQVKRILRRETAFAGANKSSDADVAFTVASDGSIQLPATAVEDEKAAAPAPARRPAALAVAKALAEAAPLLP